MKRAAHIIILLILAALALAGCKPAEPVCGSQITEYGTFTNTCGLGVPQGAKSAELFVKANLKHGRMTWELEDPTGEVVWTGFATWDTPADASTRVENPLPGRWKLSIHIDEALGEYQAPWIVK